LAVCPEIHGSGSPVKRQLIDLKDLLFHWSLLPFFGFAPADRNQSDLAPAENAPQRTPRQERETFGGTYGGTCGGAYSGA